MFETTNQKYKACPIKTMTMFGQTAPLKKQAQQHLVERKT
jgi:hypothetical protein